MAELNIDGTTYQVKDGQSLLQAIQTLGLDLPYFCWHPALGSVGACRQCAVIQYKDDNDEKGKLVMSCMVEVEDNMRISIKADQAEEFRAAVIEWLMTNHPHDCPVCDEGGECHLQDMTVMTGHNYRRHRFRKRTFRNQDLGPFIYHEMNRCITCYRCVRFYSYFAGGDDLRAIGAHNHVYFGRLTDGTLESEFSGNLVEVCPTGVFTDKTLRSHYARKWDLQSSPSVCHHCGVGCNTLVGSRYRKAVRILNRYNNDVNGYFICDRGRFGYEYVSDSSRITRVNGKDNQDEDTAEKAIERIASLIEGKSNVIGIGSPRASLESNYALKKLVGADNFSSGVTSAEHTVLKRMLSILTDQPISTASLHEIETADAVLVLGEDLTQTAPMMALAVRQAARNQPMKKADKLKIPRWNDYAVRDLMQDDRGPLYVASPAATKLDSIARDVYRATPNDIARLGFAVASELSKKAPSVDGLSDATNNLAQRIARELENADEPVVIAGSSLSSEASVEAAANVCLALREVGTEAKIAFVVPECNSMGVTILGGHDLETILEKVRSSNTDTVIILENDLYYRLNEALVKSGLDSADNVVSLDSTEHKTTSRADIVLPVTTYAEGSGTIVNNEARAQRFFRAFPATDPVREGWRWLGVIGEQAGRATGNWQHLDVISREVFEAVGLLKGKYRDEWSPSYSIECEKIARAPHRYSGRTAMYANKTMHEPKPLVDEDAPMVFSMEGYRGRPPGPLTPFYWAPGWNSVQSLNHYQKEVGQELRGGDPGVRLIEANENTKGKYYAEIPRQFESQPNRLFLVPLHHIFGSEELSRRAKAIKELIPAAYIALNNHEAQKYGVAEGDSLCVRSDHVKLNLPVRITPALPDGVGGLPSGFPETAGLPLPMFFEISQEEKQ
jgi:NADH-quinone oxidoreductase subunit G